MVLRSSQVSLPETTPSPHTATVLHTPEVQVPAMPPVVHAVPSGATGLEQPLPLVQVPARRQGCAGVETAGGPGVQLPFWQVSLSVQVSPSLQEVPLLALLRAQVPVEGLQAPLTLHAGGGAQVMGVPAPATPP